MRTVKLRATARHATVPNGQVYEVGGQQALRDLALRRGTAYKHRASDDVVPVVEEPVVMEEVPKRRYRRRDMTAE